MAHSHAVGSGFAHDIRWHRSNGLGACGLSERHWALLTLIAEHGVLSTAQIATIAFASRASASRHLGSLFKAGLIHRITSGHAALYEVGDEGIRLLRRRAFQMGQPVPVELGRLYRHPSGQTTVNEFFVRLIAHSRATGQGLLYQWHHALDTRTWLRNYGIINIYPCGHGVWIEDTTTVGFLLHFDNEIRSPYVGPPTIRQSPLLDDYRYVTGGLPIQTVLIVAPTWQRETDLCGEIVEALLPITVAVTTRERLIPARSPSGRIWTAMGSGTQLLQLVDIVRLRPSASPLA